MDRHKHHVTVLVSEFHHLLYATHVIPHAHETSEYTHSVVYMHHIIPDIEGAEVIEGQLLALIHGTPQTHPVETVEYLVVGVAAYLVLRVNEPVVDILAGNELRYYAAVLQQYGAEPRKLGFLLSIDVHLVFVLQPRTDVGGKNLEILIENRLWRYGEHYPVAHCAGNGSVNIYFPETSESLEKLLVGIHVGRIQPE